MNPSNISDEILIQQAREGDKGAFRQLVMRYELSVAATVIGMLGRGPEAEEVGQDVFIRFYKSMYQFKGNSSLGTYLTRIAINLSLNSLKKRQRRQKLGLERNTEAVYEQWSDKGEEQTRRDIDESIQFALKGLKAEYRSVIVLRLIDGYSTQETAEILKIPMGTVLSRLARGQKKMREILREV